MIVESLQREKEEQMEHRIFRAVKLHGIILYTECMCQDTVVIICDVCNTEQTVM